MANNGLNLIQDLGLIGRAEVCLNSSLLCIPSWAPPHNQLTPDVIKAPQRINGSQSQPCSLISVWMSWVSHHDQCLTGGTIWSIKSSSSIINFLVNQNANSAPSRLRDHYWTIAFSCSQELIEAELFRWMTSSVSDGVYVQWFWRTEDFVPVLK